MQEVASIGRECELATGNQFVFQYSSMAVSLSDFYPSSAHHRILWNLFEENVAPLAMIFHKPWLTSILNSAGATAIVDDKAFEAVRFAVYFAATTSMSPEQCTETSSQGSHPCSDTTGLPHSKHWRVPISSSRRAWPCFRQRPSS